MVALKGMLLQVEDLPKFYRKSKWDALLWVLTFIAVVLLDIDSGLLIGIILNLLLLIYRGIKNEATEVAPVEGTGLVVEVSECEFAFRPQEATVVRLRGVLSFANFETTCLKLTKLIKHLPEKDKEVRSKSGLKSWYWSEGLEIEPSPG